MKNPYKNPNSDQIQEFLNVLKSRVQKQNWVEIDWKSVETELLKNEPALNSLYFMEQSGGEPNVVKSGNNQIVFMDCSKESPKERRSCCYDKKSREERKKYPPETSAMEFAELWKVELFNEEDYAFLQSLADFDTKTSSWLNTPTELREKGGALFGDKRYGRTFFYHNGADSYYAARGFRAKVTLNLK